MTANSWARWQFIAFRPVPDTSTEEVEKSSADGRPCSFCENCGPSLLTSLAFRPAQPAGF